MIKQQKELVVFDVDGTLINSGKKVRQDVIDAFTRLGINGVTHQEVRQAESWYGLAKQYGIDEKRFDVEFDRRKSWEQALRDGDAPLFEDVIPCLEQLASQGVVLATISRSLPAYAKAKLDYHNLSRYFQDRVAITDIKAPSKEPEAHQLIKIIGKPNISQAYFIGDRAEDVTVAKPVQDKWELISSGIYLNREQTAIPKELEGYRVITSLSELEGVMQA